MGESSSRNLRVLDLEGGRSRSADSGGMLLYTLCKEGRVRIVLAVGSLWGTRERDESVRAGPPGRPLTISLARRSLCAELSRMWGCALGGDVPEPDMITKRVTMLSFPKAVYM